MAGCVHFEVTGSETFARDVAPGGRLPGVWIKQIEGAVWRLMRPDLATS